MSIQVLPPKIADQIAAGEVVERPSSAVKELVENAIDAGAQNIEIFIKSGGKKHIEVRDDGRGMEKEDAKKCFLRHATSKIKHIDDLFSIQSFGFRGEALAALSAVSDFELLTKTATSNAGTKINISAGKLEDISSAPANTGTHIIIRDLFFPTPARLQYLKTEETEYRTILNEIISFALSKPEIGFRLFKEGKQTLDFPKTENHISRIQKILKNEENDLLKTKHENSGLKITGFISRPEKCAKTKKHQYLFVNGRRIEDFRLNFAVREAYRQSCGIEKHLHPVFVLYLKLDPILVDVNVHPRKLEVKFSEPGEVFSNVKKAVIFGLEKGNKSIGISYKPQYTSQPRHARMSNKFSEQMFGPSFAEKNVIRNEDQLSNFSFESERSSSLRVENKLKTSNFKTSEQPPVTNRQKEQETRGNLKLIGQLARKYILAESENGLFIFDQHALHERQRFEKLYAEYETKKICIQKLLLSEKISMPEAEISILQENTEELAGLGFKIKFPDAQTLEITEIPILMAKENLQILIQDLINYFENEKIAEHSVQKLLRKILESRSCREAVMFGDQLSPEEMQKLLDDFSTTKWNLLCPHGRPNHVFWGFEELDRKFHR